MTKTPIVLMLNGYDEVPTYETAIMPWPAEFDPTVVVILTSRPAAVDDATRVSLARLGFEGRRIADLTPRMVQELNPCSQRISNTRHSFGSPSLWDCLYMSSTISANSP